MVQSVQSNSYKINMEAWMEYGIDTCIFLYPYPEHGGHVVTKIRGRQHQPTAQSLIAPINTNQHQPIILSSLHVTQTPAIDKAHTL